jgi:dCMP deaminase
LHKGAFGGQQILKEVLSMKRTDYISWDEYFMGIAMLAAKRSKDPSTQVGACIVSPENIIISTGYNGMPKGCSDDEFPWERSGEDENETKYPFVVHAELNAILNANGRDLRGSRLYVALFPCNECAKAIIQCGIKEVIYLSDKYNGTPSNTASKRMLRAAGINYIRMESQYDSITLDLKAE